MTQRPYLSIITPCHNNGDTLRECLTALLSQQNSPPFEILVIDDGSTDNSAAIAQSLVKNDDRLRYLHQEQGGVSKAVNRGITESRATDLIALVEADVCVTPGWMEKIIAPFADPQVTGAGGFLATAPEDNWIARLAGYEIEDRMESRPQYVPHISATNAVYRREIFDKIGNMDESLVNACQDVEFNQRLIASGDKIAFVPEAKVWHHYKGSFVGFCKRNFLYALWRPFIPKMHMYERDRNITIQMGLTGLLGLSVPIALSTFTPALLILFALLVAQLPMIRRIYEKTKDPVVLIYPPVLICRNAAGILGILTGYAKKFAGGSR